MYKITLENKKTKEVINYNNIIDANNGEKLFYKFNINTSNLEDGEYTLTLFEDDNLILTDTLCVGDFSVSGLQYNRGEDIYVETKMSTITEEKDVTINTVRARIVPSEGSDAMTSVLINAKPVYDGGYLEGNESGYNSGFSAGQEDGYNTGYNEGVAKGTEDGYNEGLTAGFEQGVNEQKGKLTSIEITKNGTYSNEDGYNEVNVLVEGAIEGSYAVYDFEGVTNYYNLFYNTPITDFNIDFSNAESTSRTFYECKKLTKIKPLNLPVATNLSYMFYRCSSITDVETIYAPNAEDLSSMFNGCSSLQTVPDLELPSATTLYYLFADNIALTRFPNIDAPNVTDASALYYNIEIPTQAPTLKLPKLENASNMFFGCKGLTSVSYSFPELKNAESMFSGCSKLTDCNLYAPKLESAKSMFSVTSSLVTAPAILSQNLTNTSLMFNTCTKLETVPLFDTSKVLDMSQMFYYCQKLVEIPHFNTSSCTNMSKMFHGCSVLKTIPQLDMSKVTNVSNIFYSCNNLESLPLLDWGSVTTITQVFPMNPPKLTTLGGFKDLKVDWKGYYSLAYVNNLTYESIMNVINNLYDFRGNGDNSTTRTLQIHSNQMAMLSDSDKAIATSKGWIITS